MKCERDSRRAWLRSPASLCLAVATSLVGAVALASPAASIDPLTVQEPDLLVAMQRDLGVAPHEAGPWLQQQARMSELTDFYRAYLDESFAGAWIAQDAQGGARLVVASNAPERRRPRHAEVDLVQVDYSLKELQAMTAALDHVYRGSVLRRPGGLVIAGWYADVERNRIVVEFLDGHVEPAIDLVAASGIPVAAVDLRAVDSMPALANSIVGGQRYNLNSGGWCSIGFSARRAGQDGYVTAGHCGQVGTGTTGFNGLAQGVFEWSVFPTADSAWVRITNPAWTLTPQVETSSGLLAVVGQNEAPVNAAICRSGARTGWRCGTVTGLNQTVNYPQGTVFGLTRASACVGQGDSGGAFITPDGHAQGVTSGGQLGSDGTNCGFANPVTFFQPLQSLLAGAGATLVTGSGGGGSPPTITAFVCPDRFNSGSLMFMCYVEYQSASPAQAQWQSSHQVPRQGEWYFGRCGRFDTVAVSVTVSNAFGQASRSTTFACPTWPIP
ncbi:MAG: S1 family peptidase [Xanthomonadales bacterium]|nr:S1 family peptidase [Xanthomonadales bacterium]